MKKKSQEGINREKFTILLIIIGIAPFLYILIELLIKKLSN